MIEWRILSGGSDKVMISKASLYKQMKCIGGHSWIEMNYFVCKTISHCVSITRVQFCDSVIYRALTVSNHKMIESVQFQRIRVRARHTSLDKHTFPGYQS